jgi:hypothetical protein
VTSTTCNFCGGSSHFIQECKVVAEYNRAGKCKYGPDSRVVLPSGVMVPCNIQGNWLRNCMDEWHQQNPRQTALQMILEVAAAQTISALAGISVGQFSIGKHYKPMACKIRPIETELPSRFHIIQDIKGDLLQDMPALSLTPPNFTLRGRYTNEQHEQFDTVHTGNFLLPESVSSSTISCVYRMARSRRLIRSMEASPRTSSLP